jgi:hypothetical protein
LAEFGWLVSVCDAAVAGGAPLPHPMFLRNSVLVVPSAPTSAPALLLLEV